MRFTEKVKNVVQFQMFVILTIFYLLLNLLVHSGYRHNFGLHM